MDVKKINAASSTITRDLNKLDKDTENIYETVNIIAKRANQVGAEIKQDLNRKLEEFAFYTDNLEEVFENREQIDISKFYEKLPKPTLIATQEFIDGKLRYTEKPAETTGE
ncbi:MAG: DNA-directed RNA polymerase subunit omega [Bacteroidales bacterium]|nr:DNA-directed RNA polymerase subunit omega [Bacteroidales bacterium]